MPDLSDYGILADLFAFIRQTAPPAKPKTFEGNKPELVRAAKDGTLLLTAMNCEVYGSTLVFEKHHANLGYWNSDDDYAAWIVTIAAALCGAIQIAGGDKLGLGSIAMAWIAVIASVLGTVNGFLPPLQRKPAERDNSGPRSDPDPMPRDV